MPDLAEAAQPPGVLDRYRILLRDRIRLHRTWLVVTHDLVAVLVSFPLAILLRDPPADQMPEHLLPVLGYGVPLLLGLALLVFSAFGTTRSLWRHASTGDLATVAKAATLLILAFYLGLFLIDRLITIPRSLPLIHWFVLVGLLCGARLFYATVLVPYRERQEATIAKALEPVLLVGAGSAAAVLIQLLNTRTSDPLAVVGILDDRPGYRGRTVHGVPVVGGLVDLGPVVAKLALHGTRPKRVVFATSHAAFTGESLDRLYHAAEQDGLVVEELSDLLRLAGSFEPGSAEAAAASCHVERRAFFAIKRVCDVGVALAGLVAAAPFMAVIALAILADLGAPVLFHQVRPGRGLRPFTLYKFRTLRDGCSLDGRILTDAERQTRLGGFLRRTRLDELPQLWNVLLGDMSLIGPRPLLPRDLPDLGEALHERFDVRPGITGWAQVSGGHQLSMDDKLNLDLWYIRNYSPRLDARIVIKTFGMMIFGERIDSAAIEKALT